ncbi:conserved putative secreted protein [Candidatus Protochlamydia naegleriophila]|uniref:Conserved putative secreted protein n=1 Tax=Candidatus Protochlamydia naegleriophila TaxID=389348 RepID=A0A0U5JC61_9BACT|nr:membrane protein insertion efficiency factor YidD [Candidatus Protochlamydia naegleriophila]CUI15967.1 conserved putative secreted protein [Candidatus Protochlamydia naegleriophila]
MDYFRRTLLLAVCASMAITAALFSNPWGKDADLAVRTVQTYQPPEPPSLLARLGVMAIRFHQEVISPADGPRSHFIPSSSQYTLEAMKKYGFFKGYTMGCDRLMREDSEEWVYRTIYDAGGRKMKWDPVP